MEINNPHNNYFISVFSNLEIARDFIRTFLPEKITSELDLRTLRTATASFIDKKLKEKYSDLVYYCKIKSNNKTDKYRYISILFEHKSTIDSKQLPLQLLGYLSNGYDHNKKQKQKQGLIIPTVVYHGKQKVSKKKLLDIVPVPNLNLSEYLPNFDFVLININELTDEQLIRLKITGMLRDALMLLKYIWQMEHLLGNLQKIFSSYEEYLNSPMGQNFLNESFVYILSRNDKPEDVITLIITSLPEPLKNSTMSTLEMIIQRGKKEGKKEEQLRAIRGFLEMKVDVKTIAKALKLSERYVQKIKDEMIKNGEL